MCKTFPDSGLVKKMCLTTHENHERIGICVETLSLAHSVSNFKYKNKQNPPKPRQLCFSFPKYKSKWSIFSSSAECKHAFCPVTWSMTN